MSFDKDGDKKLSEDELPERMRNMMARGDENQDKLLDEEEIKKMAEQVGGGFGGGRGGRGGFGGEGGEGRRGRGGEGGRRERPEEE